MKTQLRYKKGDKIGGRYQVHQALMGGMGEVYLCLDLEENYPYALKTFQQHYLTDTQRLRQAFEQEVAIWVALEKHPNIVRCFFMDILDSQPFVLLEWIMGDESRGTTLLSWLRPGEPLDLQMALDFTIDIGRGLLYADQKQPGIVHRDLSPKNILVTQDHIAKITDFGLAKIIRQIETDSMTDNKASGQPQAQREQGWVVGTPQYMAPEQWRNEAVDARTDIYALGCILYEMLIGRMPYQAVPGGGFRHQHLSAPIPKLPESQRHATALNRLLVRCLAKQPAERFNRITDLLIALSDIYLDTFDKPPKELLTGAEFTAADYNRQGGTYNYLQRYEAALVAFNKAIELVPDYTLAYNNRGNTYRGLGNHKVALTDFSRAIELDPDYAIAYNNRGNTYHDLQDYTTALMDFDQAIQLDATYALAYINRGSTYRMLGRHEAALADFQRAIELDGQSAKAYYNRGNVCADLQKYEAALTDFSQSIQLDPLSVPSYINRGNTYHALRQYQQALSDYNRAIDLEPVYAKAYHNRGNTQLALGHYDAALVDLNHSIRLEPTNAKAYNDRGLIYARQQQYKQALADFNRAIDLNASYAAAYNNRGNVYDVLQQHQAAETDFRRAIALDYNHANAHFNLGAHFADRDQWREALPYFEKAAQLGYPSASKYVDQARKLLGIESSEQQSGFFRRIFKSRK